MARLSVKDFEDRLRWFGDVRAVELEVVGRLQNVEAGGGGGPEMFEYQERCGMS